MHDRYGKILNLYTPEEPLFCVARNKEIDEAREINTEWIITKVVYLALCKDGKVHPMESVDGLYDFCDDSIEYYGIFNRKELHNLYNREKNNPRTRWFVLGEYEIKRLED